MANKRAKEGSKLSLSSFGCFENSCKYLFCNALHIVALTRVAEFMPMGGYECQQVTEVVPNACRASSEILIGNIIGLCKWRCPFWVKIVPKRG